MARSSASAAVDNPMPELLRRVRTKVPKTARGARTRGKVLDAARVIFDRDGYGAARVSDMAESAGIALGTFYTYFDDKRDVLAALLEDVFQQLYVAARSDYLGEADPEVILRQSIHEYMSVYRANRDLLRTLIEAATGDDEFAALWFEIRGLFLARVVRNVTEAQRIGLAEPMNPVLVASALGGMLENFCWIWFSMDGERLQGKPILKQVDFEEMVDVVTKLWLAALFTGADRADRP